MGSRSPFLKLGDTYFDLTINNLEESLSDNVFGLFFTSTFLISKVDDTAIPSTPEPQKYAMLLAGLGFLGGKLRDVELKTTQASY
jgi:hypothetical protein